MMDYQAVVLAGGRGSRMTELTNMIPKCLLPVANIPMIVYPMMMLQNANFNEAILLVPKRCTADVKRILLEHHINLKLDFVEVPDDDERDLGTAQALLLALPRITKNILLISCDFISDFPLTKFFDWHEMHANSVSVLLSKTSIQGNAPGPKFKRKPERDLFGIQSDKNNRLVFMAGEADIEEDNKISLHPNFLIKFPRVDFTTKLTDCHLYIINKHLLDFIKILPNEFDSLKSEFLPYLLKIQHYTWASLKQDMQKALLNVTMVEDCGKLLCAAYIMNNDEFSLCARLNTTGSYFETNKQVLKLLPKLFPGPTFAPLITSHSATGAQVGADSALGQGTCSGTKTQIKRSVVGKHCVIGSNCKINNSLIMDHVRLGDGSTLVNCIVCHSAEIPEKCDLKDCLFGTNQRVGSGTKITAEIVGENGKMMEF